MCIGRTRSLSCNLCPCVFQVWALSFWPCALVLCSWPFLVCLMFTGRKMECSLVGGGGEEWGWGRSQRGGEGGVTLKDMGVLGLFGFEFEIPKQ